MIITDNLGHRVQGIRKENSANGVSFAIGELPSRVNLKQVFRRIMESHICNLLSFVLCISLIYSY